MLPRLMANIIFYINALKARCVYICSHSPSAGTYKKTEYIISRRISFIYIFGPPAEQWIDHNQTHTPLEYYYYMNALFVASTHSGASEC